MRTPAKASPLMPTEAERRAMAERDTAPIRLEPWSPRKHPRQPSRGSPVGKYQAARVLAKNETTVMRECTGCFAPFIEPRRHGRPFSKCPDCR